MKRKEPLVSYDGSSSEDETQDRDQCSTLVKQDVSVMIKRRKLPTLSDTFVPHAPKDDPTKHQGRVRTTPHTEGQYAAYVYVPLGLTPDSKLTSILTRIYARAKELAPTLHPIGISETQNPDEVMKTQQEEKELHLSISRPIYLRAHQREEFKLAVKRIAKTNERFTASLATFSELQNDERTRTFLTVEVGAGHHELKALSNALVPTLRSIRQKEFYTDPRFHVSIGWALLEPSSSQLNAPAQVAPNQEKSEVLNAAESSTTQEYPKIPKLPEELIPTLVSEFGPTLAESLAAKFEVDTLCVRIGKDVNRWKLNG